MEATTGNTLLEAEIKLEIEDTFEFVKVEPADYEESPRERNNEDISNDAKSCDEDLNLVTIKEEEIQIKPEENWEQNNPLEDFDHTISKSYRKPKKRNLKKVDYVLKKDIKVLLYKCQNCIFKCKSRKLFIKHSLKCSGNCKTCNNHEIGFVGVKTESLPPKKSLYQCTHCPYASGLKDTYLRHLKRHQHLDEQDLVNCNECPFSSRHKISLIRHVKKHRTKADFPCKYCTYCVTTAAHLASHEQLHERNHKIKVKVSKPDESLHKCEQCPYVCSTQAAFERHKACHDSIIGTKCCFCTFTTENANLLGVHRKLHTLEPFKCTKCSYETWKASNFKTHCSSHEPNHQMHQCQQCPYVCSCQKAFKRHKASHDAGTGIKCEFCSFKTEHASLLGRHRKLHTLEPFKCTKCSYETRTASSFRSHCFTHEPKLSTLLKCDKCRYETFRGDLLQRHFRNKHKNE